MSFSEWSNAKKKKKEEEESSKSSVTTKNTASGSTGSGSSSQSFSEWSNQKKTGSSVTGYNEKDASAGWNAFLKSQQEKDQKEEEKSWFDKALEIMSLSGDTTLPGSALVTVTNAYRDDTSYREPTEKWNEQQKKDFGYLYGKDQNKAWEYAENLNNAITKAEKDAQKKKITENAVSNPVLHTAGALATAPMGLADYLNDMAEKAARGKVTEKELSPFEYSQTVTSGISENLNEKHGTLDEDIPIIGGKGWGDVYGLGTSIAQSAIAGYTGGQAGTLIQFFGSAAASGFDEAKNRGATDDQALAYGTMAGAAEGLAEMIGVDNLFKIGSSSTMRQLMKNVLKQGAAEGIEEGLTSVMNNFADQLVMQDKSNFYILVQQLMAQGMSEEEAKKKAWKSMANDLAYDMVAGFVSGAAHAGPHTAVQTFNESVYQPYQTGKAIMESDGSVDALKQLAQDVAGVSSAEMQKAITEQTGKVDKKQSAVQVGRLYNTVQTANDMANASANQADIAKSLMRKGFNSETANDTAEALVASYNGQELTEAQEKILKSAEGNSAVKEAVSNIMRNTKSTMGQRNQNIRNFQKDVTIGRVAKATGLSADEVKKLSEGNLTTTEEIVPESHYEVSAEGKTIDKEGNDLVINGISSIENGRMVLQTDTGTIDASDVAYASQGEALVYEAVASLSGMIDTNTANKLSKHLMKLGGAASGGYIGGIVQAYTYGYHGYGRDAMLGEDTLSADLTEKQRNVAYGLGEQYSNAKTAADQEDVAKNATTTNKVSNKGKVHYDGDRSKLTERQRASISTLETVAEALGVQIYVFESKVGENGKRIGANGWYDPKDNSIHIDLHAGANGEGTMLFTAAHELVHHIRKWSPAKFKILADFLMQEYGKKGVSVDALVRAQIAKAKRAGRTISYDTAYEEVIADSMETMLSDGNVVEKLAKLKQKDESLWKKIKDFISELAQKIREVYEKLSPDSVEGRYVAEMKDAVERLQELFVEGLVDASENFQMAEKNTTDDGGDILHSLREFDDGTRFVDVQMDASTFDGMTVAEMNKAAKTILMDRFAGKVIGIDNRVFVNGDSVNEYLHPSKSIDLETRKAKLTAAGELDNLLDAGTALPNKPDGADGHIHPNAIDFSYFKTIFKVGNEYFEGIVNIVNNKRGKLLKDVTKIKNITQDIVSSYGQNPKSNFLRDVSMYSIRNESGNVKNESTEAMDLEVDEKTESVAPAVLFSERTWTESDYVQEREKAAQEIANAIGVSKKKAKAYIDSVNSIAKMIAEDRVRLDYFSSPGRSSFVGNVEYGGSFDFSTLCKKRRLLTGTFTAIQKALPNTALTADEILDIRNRMKEKGLEVSCGLCYVEGSRANMGQFAKEFLKLYKQYYPDAWQPNMADVNTPDGIEWVRINHPECYEQYEYFWNHYGTLKEGDKNLFASQQKPKLYQLHTEYKGEILEKFKDDSNVEEKNLNGGIRLQSFSDFEIVHLIDTMQIIMDMSRVGLAGQAYTKVPDFAWALGDTGLKINLSLIAKGVDADGKLIFDDVEGMPIADAVALRNRYSKNVGTILVAFNDEQLMAAMADDRVDYIIPFHRSQWKKSQYGAMGLPAKTKDYTFMQNEKFIKPQYHEYRGRMVKDKATNYMPNEYWDFSKSGKENAEAYLEMCARNNKRPKFYKLLQNNGDGSYSLKADGSTDGYWKLLIDFKMYDNDGVGSPQMAVKPEFNMEEATRMLDTYQGGHSNFPVAQGIVDEFVKEYKDSHKGVKYSDRSEFADSYVKYSERVTDKETLDFLNKQKTITTYKTMQLVDGKLYPPMAARTNGEYEDYSVLGEWEQATEHPELIRNGNKYKLDKGKGQGSIEAAYNPYMHSSNLVLNDQFSGAYTRDNLVTVECEVPESELTSGYHAQYAKDSVGWHSWHTGTVAGSLRKAKGVERQVFLSRWIKPVRIVPDSEVASMYKDLLDGTDVAVPDNVVTPSLLRELKNAGVNTKESGRIKYSDRDNAPTFYSHMARVVDGVKQEKLGAASVVSMLRGKGVKAEEIKWSGIEDWLAGKKSVTKAELQEFIAGSMLHIEEETLDDKELPYSQEHLDQIAKYEAERDTIAENLKSEWKRIVGTDIPIRYFGAGLESAVVNNLMEANATVKGNTEAGYQYKAKKAALQRVIENSDDYYGYDYARQAFKEAVRNPEEFMRSFELTSFEKSVFRDFIKAKEAYNKVEGISVQDQRTLIAIAASADRFSSRINKVKQEHRAKEAKKLTKWSQYKLKGGGNYRELLFKTPGSGYSNDAMYAHWEDRSGVLAHARVQDFNTAGGKMLFVEEIQSDWHNEGHKSGYTDGTTYEQLESLKDRVDMARSAVSDAYIEYKEAEGELMRLIMDFDMMSNNHDQWQQLVDACKEEVKRTELAHKEARREYAELENELHKHAGKVPDAPFKDTYHEYVMKRLLRMAAEEGYDSIGWTPSEIQVKRWSKEFEEGYRIEYDQEIPKFMNKYGKKWGAKVGTEYLATHGLTPEQVQEQEAELLWLMEENDSAMENMDIDIDDLMADIRRSDTLKADLEKLKGTKVWSMPITDAMKESVLTEGQPLYQDRDTESVSNRSLLANAFEGLAQNDIERNKIQEYKGKIDLINSEERKLQELNEQIKELSFAKGPKDTAKIRELQFEAKQTANRISTYDKQLLRLEASKPLQDVLTREKQMAYKRAEQKGKQALAEYKEKAAKTQRELIDRYQKARERGIESREKTAMRHKIKDVVNELNQYLLHGTKDKRVMMGLKKAVAEALDAVNMDTVGAEERIAKLEAELLQAKTPEAIQEISRKIDHVREMGDKMSNRLKALKDAYREIAESDDPLIANSHDEVIEAKLESVIEKVGNTPLRDMNLEQLSDVYDMYRMVLTTIRNSNKAFKAAKSESIAVLGNRVMEEVEKVGGKRKYNVAAVEAIKKFGWNNLKPVYAFQHIGSDTFTQVFNAVRNGEDVWAQDVTEAREFYLEKSKKFKYDSWDFNKRYGFTSASGMNFSLNLEQIMSLYAYSKRDQAADHLKRGGIVFDETTEVTMKTKMGFKVKFNPTEATAYNISDETLADIISKLTPEQKQFVDEMQEYLSTTMGEKGNEVSLELYGIKLFKEKFYFPLKSATQFMAKAKEQQQGEVKIKNSGFSKETVKKANNPIVLTPFMNVWAGHVNEMSMYHAFVLPMEDFYRVWSYRTPTSDSMATESVEMFIQNAYGKGATKYIDQLLKDLNGGARTDSTTGIINKMMGLFKKGAVFASLSVVVQQPSAIARATALVDTKYFIGPKVDHKRHKALWEEVKQYAPVAIIKEMGYFDTNMGKSTQDFIMAKEHDGWLDLIKRLDVKGLGKNTKDFVIDSDYRDEVLSWGPAFADELAWCIIWEAVKRETNARYPKLDTKSEAFLTLAGKRFTEVITKTQVYDSVLARSANMRSKDTGMKMATAFMGEPTTSINMVADALLKGKRGNKKYAAGAIGAVIASNILNSILVSFVYAGRDDDEDETYAEKYIGTLTAEILDGLNPATYIPFIKDIVSIVQGYDVERSDMAVISDLWNAYQKLGSDKLSTYRKVEGFAGSIAQIFGLPVKNIMRDVRGIYQTIDSLVNGQQTTKAGIVNAVKGAVTGETVSNQNQLYEAYLSGDKTQIARVEGRYKDQKAIDTAIRKALRENDPRIHEAAQAKFNGDLDAYMSIAKEIIGEGKFSQDNVVAAINAEINALDTSESTSGSSKAAGMFKIGDFGTAVVQSDSAMANAIKSDIIRTAQRNGKTADEAEKSFVSSAKSEVKERFLAGEINQQKAISALTSYCGVEAEDAKADVQYWAYKQQYPNTYADDSWFDAYYEKVASSGISIDVYMSYRNSVADITGEGKKERRMAVIDSLPITSAQKDALYFAEGWAESKLYEAPWN